MVNVVYKIALEIWGTPPLKKLAAQKYHNFGATLQLVREYLRIGTRYHQSENCVAIYEHSCTCLYLT